MWRALFFLSLIFFVFINAGCREATEKTGAASLQPIGNIDLYTFSSDDQYFLSDAQPFVLPASTPVKEALTILGRRLSKGYFSDVESDQKADIRFEVIRLQEIPVKPEPVRIAIINMIDKQRLAMRYFFQGSTGGQTTFSMLGATFIQPHLDNPLLDGLVILYNGETLPELDHINLSGILTPRLVKYVAKRAIHNTKMESASAVREWVQTERLDL